MCCWDELGPDVWVTVCVGNVWRRRGSREDRESLLLQRGGKNCTQVLSFIGRKLHLESAQENRVLACDQFCYSCATCVPHICRMDGVASNWRVVWNDQWKQLETHLASKLCWKANLIQRELGSPPVTTPGGTKRIWIINQEKYPTRLPFRMKYVYESEHCVQGVHRASNPPGWKVCLMIPSVSTVVYSWHQ